MKIGIIGCGKIAPVHCHFIKKHYPERDIVFCDRNLKKAETYAKRYSSKSQAYNNAEKMYENENIHSTHILTQIMSHVDLIQIALSNSSNVYVEKPITETLSEFEKLNAVAKERNALLYSGYSALGTPNVQTAKKLIESEKYGQLIAVHCIYNWSAKSGIPYGDENHWAYTLKGGILQNLACHPASLVLDVIDEVKDFTVLSESRSNLPHQTKDLLMVAVSNNTQIGSFTMSFGHGNTQGKIIYSLESATIEVDLRSQYLTIIEGKGPISFQNRMLSGIKTSLNYFNGTLSQILKKTTGALPTVPGVSSLLNNYYELINGEGESIVTLETSKKVIGLLEKVWEKI